MGENEGASATERAWAVDPMLHLKVESREMSRHASSIKDKTSKINPPGEERIHPRTGNPYRQQNNHRLGASRSGGMHG